MQIIKTAANVAAINFAMERIAQGGVDKTSKWDFDKEDANKIATNDKNLEVWFLGDVDKGTDNFINSYPIGKNGKIYRNALLTVRQRAAQNDDQEIFAAAGAIIDRIDGKTATMKMKKPAMRQIAWTKFELLKAYDPEEDTSDDNQDDDNSGERTITGIASTPNPDRMGDIVEPKGAQYDLPISYLWQHDSSQPIGNVIKAKVTNDGILTTTQIASMKTPGTLKDRLDEAWQSIKSKLVRGQSIGFAPIEFSYMSDTGGYHFLKWAWLELSAVTIPANADASIATIKSCDMAMMRKNHRVADDMQRKYGIKLIAGTKSYHLSDKTSLARPTVPERKKFGQDICDTNAASMDEIIATRQRVLSK